MLKKKRKFKVRNFTYYSYAAPFIVNGDDSGLSTEERIEVETFLSLVKQRYGAIRGISVNDDSDFARPSIDGATPVISTEDGKYTPLIGDCLTYTILV